MPDLTKLKELKELLDAGVLTQEEFDSQKQKILEAPDVSSKEQIPIQPLQAVPSGVMQPMQHGSQGSVGSMITMVQPWNGVPPPKDGSSWFLMYKPMDGRSKIGPDGLFVVGKEPDDCFICLKSCCCVPCTNGEAVEWASDGKTSCIVGCLCGAFCPMCAIPDTRKSIEEKIHKFHKDRGDAKAAMMPPNHSAHDTMCGSWCLLLLIPFVGGPIVQFLMVGANIENYFAMKKFQLLRQREESGEISTATFTGTAPQAQPVLPQAQPVEAKPVMEYPSVEMSAV